MLGIVMSIGIKERLPILLAAIVVLTCLVGASWLYAKLRKKPQP